MKIKARKRIFPGGCGLAALLVALLPAAGFGAGPQAGVDASGPEPQLQRILEDITRTRLDTALAAADRLTLAYPNFRLGHLVRGDLLLARARPLSGIGNTGHAAPDRLEELRAETYARARALTEHPPEGFVPRYLLRLAPDQKHAIVVDAGRSRVYVYENREGVPQLVEDYYTTIGKRGIEKIVEGDQKTPIGVYHVTAHIPGRKLPDLYGWGAFPIDYPNEWDRLQRKTGYGIWLHGVPSDTYARAPLASDGCIALANPDIEAMARRVRPGSTPVIIAKQVDWVSRDFLRADSDGFAQALEAWRSDWESLDMDRYLAHYARDFRSDRMDAAQWKARKRRVYRHKTWVRIALENPSVFRSPAAGEPVVVTFDQDYRSNSFSQRIRKRQYWVQEDGRWKIAYEAPAAARPKLRLPESYTAAVR